MKKPLLQSTAFVQDVQAARRAAGASENRLRVWWLGQSGYLVLWADRFLLIDPYLSDSLTRKYARTDKPHVRMTELVVDPGLLEDVVAVTSSHNHTDHLDPETLGPLVRANPGLVLVGPEANRSTLRERSGLPDACIRGLTCDVPGAPAAPEGVPRHTEVGGFRITAVPAAHEALDRNSDGHPIYLGYVIEAGPFRIYHSGDTVPYAGMEEVLRPFRPDLALLPINGRAPERRVSGNLWGREAAALAHAIGAGLVVPGHYDLFTFNTASPDEFAAACRSLGQPFRILEQGEGLDLPGPRS